jgi:Domain of unknown function (DUF6916)
MVNLSEVTRQAFEPFVEQTFMVSTAEGSFEARLIEVAPMGQTPGPNGRQAFSLVLRGPQADEPRQGIYRVAHGELGTLDLFLVPIGSDAQGTKYEAVFT